MFRDKETEVETHKRRFLENYTRDQQDPPILQTIYVLKRWFEKEGRIYSWL